MSGASLLALALREGENDTGADEKAKLREQLSKGNVPKEVVPPVKEEGEGDPDADPDADGPELDEDGNPVEKPEETAEEKEAREKTETEEAKNRRKEDRIQKRIDKAVAAQRVAEAEVIKLKEQLAANPDKTLTEEEVQRRADAIASEKITAKELENLQKEFNKNCDKIQASAEKLDKEFNKKIHEIAADLGPLPTRMMNVLFDLDNGADVLNFLASDVDEAERIYDLQNKPEKLGIALSKISDKLAEAKKPKPKEISKVPDPMAPVNGNRVQSTQIVAKDMTPDGMENYVRKRQLQIEQRRKQGR